MRRRWKTRHSVWKATDGSLLSEVLVEQLAQLKLKPEDVDIVGISHMHPDHTGQAAQFANATLLIGKGDFEQTVGKDDPFAPWRGQGKKVTPVTADQWRFIVSLE